MKKIILLITALILLSCSNPFYDEIIESERNFNYETTGEVRYIIDTIYPNVPIEIHYNGLKRVFGISDSNGMLNGSTTFPTFVKEVELITNYIGLPNRVNIPITNGKIEYKYFTNVYSLTPGSRGVKNNKSSGSSSSVYNTLGTWNSQGVPDYLIESEEVTNSFLTLLNSLLPEKQPVPEYNPQYLSEGAITNINIVEDGEVFVTFIHEGAGYKNSLMFFTYDTASGAPETVTKDNLTIIFPNVSFTGSGGELETGNRVKIGNFTAGTTIAWAIVANGFNNGSVDDGLNTFYSVDSLNIETEPYNQHVVQIAFDERVVLSFEDLERPDGDNDFNDAIFSVSSNPITSIDRTNIVTPEESPTLDSDGDGITDNFDPYPNNSNIAGVEFYPAENAYGTLAYEDLWPYMGDYDFNDLVIDLRFEEYTDANGDIVSIKSYFIIQGILASMRNGFAIELGVTPNRVSEVTGGEFSRGYIKRSPNGTEERQSRAVIGIFEDANLHFINNIGTELEITINFNQPVSREELGFPPYNPFIMSNGERGREVHLPGYAPTDLVHQDYFNSVDDNSSFVDGDSYKTSTEHPWALHLPISFKYPYDDKAIDTVYNYFNSWVLSGGTSDTDWYLDNPGNINHHLLFIR